VIWLTEHRFTLLDGDPSSTSGILTVKETARSVTVKAITDLYGDPLLPKIE